MHTHDHDTVEWGGERGEICWEGGGELLDCKEALKYFIGKHLNILNIYTFMKHWKIIDIYVIMNIERIIENWWIWIW